MNLCYVSDYCLAMMRSGAWGLCTLLAGYDAMVDIVNSTRTVIGQAACEVLPPLVAALKLSVGNFLEGKMRHFEEKKTAVTASWG